MTFNDFTQIFAESFDESPSELLPTTIYKELEDWTSMQALILIAHLDDTINVVLSAEDIKTTTSLHDLHHVVLKKL